LPRESPPDQPEQSDGSDRDRQHRWDPAKPPLEPCDDRRQEEGEQAGERHRHQNHLSPIKHSDDQNGAREDYPRVDALQDVAHEEIFSKFTASMRDDRRREIVLTAAAVLNRGVSVGVTLPQGVLSRGLHSVPSNKGSVFSYRPTGRPRSARYR
jgi:hypothetical protein